jgi:hypothetical protein
VDVEGLEANYTDFAVVDRKVQVVVFERVWLDHIWARLVRTGLHVTQTGSEDTSTVEIAFVIHASEYKKRDLRLGLRKWDHSMVSAIF